MNEDNQEQQMKPENQRDTMDVLLDISIVICAILGGLLLLAMLLLSSALLFFAQAFTALFANGTSNSIATGGNVALGLGSVLFVPLLVIAVVAISNIRRAIGWYKGLRVSDFNGWLASIGMILFTIGGFIGALSAGSAGPTGYSGGTIVSMVFDTIPFACAVITTIGLVTRPVRKETNGEKTVNIDSVSAEVATHALGHEAPTAAETKTEKDLPPMLNADPDAAEAPVGAVGHKIVTGTPVLAEGAAKAAEAPETTSDNQPQNADQRSAQEVPEIKKL